MASGASARTLFSLLAGVIALAVVALPAGAEDPGPDCNGMTPTITGTNVAEWLTGTEGTDVIRAGAGDDTINGLGGDDVVCGGPGNDTTRGGPGDDTVRSGRGNDSSSGEAGNDTMFGQGDGDIADGGTGVDGCLFETHEQCEADLDINVTGPATATKGGLGVSVYNASLVNHGPTPAVNTRIDFTLPAGATFVPGGSDPRCAATSATNVRCGFGAMGLEAPDQTHIGINFTGCTNPVTVSLLGAAEDPRTNDHVEPNTTDTQSTALTIDPSCAQAVDDSATIPHDTGANVINVLANDVNATSVATATNGAHGTVAVANGGANVTYTPAALYCGPDTFTYTVNPGGSQATVTINIPCPTAVDDTYSAQNSISGSCPPGTLVQTGPNQYRVPVLSNDINPAGAGPIKVATVTPPISGGNQHGTTTIIENGDAILFERDQGYNDTDPPVPYTFTYTIAPGGSQATVSITVDCFGID
jgi:hypothetical protein